MRRALAGLLLLPLSLTFSSSTQAATRFEPSKATQLAPTANCRITNPQEIADRPNSIGFPRPQVFGNLKNPKILVVPYSFADTTSPILPVAYANSILKMVSQYYDAQSYGQSHLTFLTTPIDPVSKLPAQIKLGTYAKDFNYKYVDENTNDARGFVIKLAALADPSWHLENYESVIFQTSDSRMAYTGIAFTSQKSQMEQDKILAPGGMVESAVLSVIGDPVVNHELGHALFRFLDLYTNFTSKYDLMGDGYNLDPNLFAWHRWLAGWLKDSQVRCIESTGTTSHHLSSVNAKDSDAKMVLVHRSKTSGVAIEQRDGGLILYSIDTTIPTGRGPIRVYDNKRNPFSKANAKIQYSGLDITIKNCNKIGCDFTLANQQPYDASAPVAAPAPAPSAAPTSAPEPPRPTLDLSTVAMGQPCNGFAGITAVNPKNETFLCKVESDGNTHWVLP